MAGESPKEIVCGLIRQILARAEAGHVEGILIGVVSDRTVTIGTEQRQVISFFAAGDVDKTNIENAMSELSYAIGEYGWQQWHWRRIPQVQAMP